MTQYEDDEGSLLGAGKRTKSYFFFLLIRKAQVILEKMNSDFLSVLLSDVQYMRHTHYFLSIHT